MTIHTFSRQASADELASDDDKRSAIRDLEKQGWKLPPPAGETE